MEIGDLVIIDASPFDSANLFGYKNGDLGIILRISYSCDVYECFIVKLFRDEKVYHIPRTYMNKLENIC